MSNSAHVQAAYLEALTVWDKITPEPDYDTSAHTPDEACPLAVAQEVVTSSVAS